VHRRAASAAVHAVAGRYVLLALALAADVLGDDERAQDVYQRLKFKLIGSLPDEARA
jgi:hypothetical protein